MCVWRRGCCPISLNRWSYGREQVRRWEVCHQWFFTDHDSDQPIYAVEPCYSTSHNRFLFPHRHWCFSVTDLHFCSVRLTAQAAGLGVFLSPSLSQASHCPPHQMGSLCKISFGPSARNGPHWHGKVLFKSAVFNGLHYETWLLLIRLKGSSDKKGLRNSHREIIT